MKKIIMAVLVCVVLFGGVGIAAAQDFGPVHTVREDCGCGLGGYAVGQETGLIWKLVGTFLNGLCANQTFAMTSGTLGCGQPQSLAVLEQMNIFVADNMDALAVDIAQGNGESLDALAEIASVPVDERPAFYSTLQQNFDKIYVSADVTNETVVNEISRILETI